LNQFLDFVKNGLKSDNILVNFVKKHSVFFGCMCSVVGRNVHFCCERYGMCMPDLFVLPPKQKLRIAVDNDIVRRVGMIQELIMVREGNMSLSDVFSA